jgi:hypothetical protein
MTNGDRGSSWRGRPLTSHEVIVATIAANTTRTGLSARQWDILISALMTLQGQRREADLEKRRGHRRLAAPGTGRRPVLTVADRLLATAPHQHLALPQVAVAALRGSMFTAFLPAVSKDALKKMSGEVRRWRINLRTISDIAELAEWMNPVIRGWMNYYGRFYRTELYSLLRRINTYLVRWARRKFPAAAGIQAS